MHLLNVFVPLFLVLQYQGIVGLTRRGELPVDSYYQYFKMPGVSPNTNDAYLCTAMPLNSTSEEWIVRYDPLASANRAHHMLLYGCSNVEQKNLDSHYWDCGHHGVCGGSKIMYAWAKNAPSTKLPDDVGFRIGGDSTVKYLVLQIHYGNPVPAGVKDESGLKMLISKTRQKYKAGIYLLVAGFVDIPPLTAKTHADVNCEIGQTEPAEINVFGYRVHAHKLGSVITGYKYSPTTHVLEEIVKGNPQWPQAFYPLIPALKVQPKDILHARCTYNSSTQEKHTFIGMTAGDEMCNLYLMYYTDREKGSDSGICGYESYPEITQHLPPSSDDPLPPNPALEEMTRGENKNKDKEITYNVFGKANVTHQITSDSGNGFGAFFKPMEPQISNTEEYYKSINMPGITPKVHDAYMCTAIALNSSTEEWVLRYDPLASANRAHHMLLFGCSNVDPNNLNKGAWDCGHHGVCQGGRIMYAWAKNAPSTQLPDDVGFRIGGSTGVKFLVLQIHYATVLPDGVKDSSGLKMTITTKQQKFKAGIFLLASPYVDIPPFTEKTHADINCRVGDTEPRDINLFAYRVHAHKLGSVISGYKYDPQAYVLSEIVKGNPQWPQAFYPMDNVITVRPDDLLHARCTYNSTSQDKHTYIGGTAGDEMCNLYLMYYTDTEKGSESGGCGSETFPTLTAALPPQSDEPLPPNPLLEEMTHGENKNKDKEITYNSIFKAQQPISVEKKTQSRKDPKPQDGRYQLKPKPVEYDDYGKQESSDDVGKIQYFGKNNNDNAEEITNPENIKQTIIASPRQGKQLSDTAYHIVENWGPLKYKLGQVTAVAVDSRGDVVIFHRGETSWDVTTFRGDTIVNQRNPIPQATLLHLQKDNGQVMHEWGANFFFMPHGLTLDKNDNIWVTDVGMHQVFKFPSGFGEGKPLLTLGTRFEPGNDDVHFCKPSGIAVLKNGEFFVSDGYCNSRIIHFSSDGKIIKQFGATSSPLGFSRSAAKEGTFNVPHALALAEDHEELCVADRENGRVQCFKTQNGNFERMFNFDEWGNRLFSVAYTPHFGGKLFAVNGPQYMNGNKVQVYEVDYTSGKLLAAFSPFNQGLSNPHDITLSEDGTELYVVEIGPNKIWKFVIETPLNNSTTSKSATDQNLEVKTGQLQEATTKAMSLFSNEYSSIGISSVVLGLIAVPIIVLSALAIIMRCRRRGSRNRYLDNSKFANGINGKHKNGGLDLESLLNKRRGFEKVSTNDIDDDELESADSDVEEFSLAATKV